MASVTVKTPAGTDAGTLELDDATFGIEPNVPVMHQVVTAQLAARRAGTQSTKTRAEVRGGGAKSWKQKGTGRARQGSIRMPQHRGGGIVHGPVPRDYSERTPKKMIAAALLGVLSDRARGERLHVIDSFGSNGAPSTKNAISVLENVATSKNVLIVIEHDDEITLKSVRNLKNVHVLTVDQLNAYDVVVSDWVIFTADTLPVDRPVTRGNHATEEAAS